MQLTVMRLTPRERDQIADLLKNDSVTNVYLMSESRLGMSPNWWGIGDGTSLRAVMLAGSLVVPYIPHAGDAKVMWSVLAGLEPAVRMMVGERQSVMALHNASGMTARDVRFPQPVMWLDRQDLVAVRAGTPLRRATRSDLDLLASAAAAMHREELGIDPLRIDSYGWRLRMGQLVERGWSWVWIQDHKVVFKAELSAWTPEVAQIQGVYTDPALRGRGIAKRAMSDLCHELLGETQACTLYVNNYNEAGLRLYRGLGFHQVAEFATVIY